MPERFREDLFEPDRKELSESPAYRFDLDRRQWIAIAGAGLLVTAAGRVVFSPGVAAAEIPPSTRLHLGEDGSITVLTGKVEVGQGSRTEILQAAAEELRVAPEALRVMLADTAATPDDGSTAGSRTTPSTVPVVRRACAAAREMLVRAAAETWNLNASQLRVESGAVVHADKRLAYADLARSKRLTSADDDSAPRGVPLTEIDDWTILGRALLKTKAREIVTGAHRYPSDIVRPNMLYGAVLRPPSYGAQLESVDLTHGKELGAVAIHDGGFVGCAAKTSYEARNAVKAIGKSAKWRTAPHPSSVGLGAYLKRRAQISGGGRRGPRRREHGDVDSVLAAAKTLEASYEIPFIQHAPMEPRAAVAEWDERNLTVWTGTQRPFGVREQLMEAFRLTAEQARVIVPDTGGGFGGKHTGEVAIEAARLAKAAGKPVSLCWTREEEFAWAYFRPAAAFEVRAGLSGEKIVAWDFTAYNPGTAGIETPYAVPNARTQYFPCDSPLREGSYRGIGATGNNFAREVFMDELAGAAGLDPLEFRLANHNDERLTNVLRAAADRFGWSPGQSAGQNRGTGIAAGFEKGSYIAICAQVRDEGERIEVERLVSAFECGAIINPRNLQAQVEGCVIQGLGAAMSEEIRFEGGQLLNGSFSQYPVPRFRDIPPMETVLLDRPDIESAGAGETPIIAVAPALANAVFAATGQRMRSLPLRLHAA
ncbi:MAG: molybdopterin-dependent oxidoreductase [Bryobacterales bacterium]|nr:molybdopterin-dependent oxidoreductase [Bryobacterales bacterium]